MRCNKELAKQQGDNCVELDGLPPGVLRQRIVAEVESRMDLEAVENVRRKEHGERNQLLRQAESRGPEPKNPMPGRS